MKWNYPNHVIHRIGFETTEMSARILTLAASLLSPSPITSKYLEVLIYA